MLGFANVERYGALFAGWVTKSNPDRIAAEPLW
jgi:hypothetical protein